jgi:hypothetical protein
MCKCANVRMCKLADARSFATKTLRREENVRMCKLADPRSFAKKTLRREENVQMCNMQMCKLADARSFATKTLRHKFNISQRTKTIKCTTECKRPPLGDRGNSRKGAKE